MPTDRPNLLSSGRVTRNKHFFKVGLIEISKDIFILAKCVLFTAKPCYNMGYNTSRQCVYCAKVQRCNNFNFNAF